MLIRRDRFGGTRRRCRTFWWRSLDLLENVLPGPSTTRRLATGIGRPTVETSRGRERGSHESTQPGRRFDRGRLGCLRGVRQRRCRPVRPTSASTWSTSAGPPGQSSPAAPNQRRARCHRRARTPIARASRSATFSSCTELPVTSSVHALPCATASEVIEVTAGTTSLDPGSGPVDPEVPWNIGSVTKSFVAIVVLQLAEQGLVDLDAGIDQYPTRSRRMPSGSPLANCCSTPVASVSTSINRRCATTCSDNGHRRN